MKKLIKLCFISVLCLLLIACGEEIEEDTRIHLPSSSSDYEGVNYQDVISDLEGAGFTNVKTEVVDDLITGWLTEDGEVEKVSVDGYTTFSTDSKYESDVEIIVIYHTFPKDEETEKPDTTEPSEKNTDIKTEEILTVDNCSDLTELLTAHNESAPIIKEFALKYEGRTIEFDGNVAYMNNHGDYDTRFDILLGSGDYDENSQQGPNFQFYDVAAYNLKLDTMFVEDVLSIGKNIHVVAVVDEYNEDTTLFRLEPVSVTER